MSNSMKSFSMALQKTLRGQASSDVLAAKAARAAKVKRMWKSALEACAGPAAAVILDHTNSIYIIRKAEEETDVSREHLNGMKPRAPRRPPLVRRVAHSFVESLLRASSSCMWKIALSQRRSTRAVK